MKINIEIDIKNDKLNEYIVILKISNIQKNK